MRAKQARAVVREAVPEDGLALAELTTQLGYPISAAEATERLARILGSDLDTLLVACLPDGNVVGWVHVLLGIRIGSGRFAELGGFVVSERHRRKGIGKELLAAAHEWAAENRVGRLRVRSQTNRADAKAFYERLGFTETKEQRVFDKTLTSDTEPAR